MLNILVTPVRGIVKEAERQASAAGSTSVEAEHLLLAVASTAGTPAHDVLTRAGLTPDAILAALLANAQRSLAAAGVTWDATTPQGAAASSGARTGGRLTFGSSARRVLQRATEFAKACGDDRLDAVHVLVGALRAEVGTVPRALAAAGVDRAALLAAAIGARSLTD